MKTSRLAAIDIGSNSLKLAVVEAAASNSFTIISQDRERVRLGHGTLRNHFLSDEAIRLSVEAISRFRSIAENREVDSILAVATASVREAQNASEFVAEVRKRTGIHVEVLPSIEEARLIGIAAAQSIGKERLRLLNIDIGGGSTEVSLMVNGEPEKLFSMKLGAVGLTEEYLLADPPGKKELKRLRNEVRFALSKPSRKIAGENWEVASGTSGTILALASMLGSGSPESLTAATLIDLKQLAELNTTISTRSLAERTAIPVINERRAEVIVAGGQILEGVMRSFGIRSIRPCGYALREGVIIDHLREIETEQLPPVPDVDDLKLRDVFAIGRRFGYEERHAVQVALLAEKIFDLIAPMFGLKRAQRTLLSAAALLHDVGYHISHEAHHKHSLYLIKHSELSGFSETEKSVIANVARYHRKALPKTAHTEFMALSADQRDTVEKLSAILRIADGLDRGYESRVRGIEIKKNEDVIDLTLISGEDLSNEIYAVAMKKEAFEKTYGCVLNITQSRKGRRGRR